ncbi:hypothetical protein Tco_0672360 [Tanacetum coccineum]
MRYKTRDTLVVVILEVICIKDLVALHFGDILAPPSPDYVPGPEEPEQAPPSLEFVPEPVYPEFMSPEDEVFPVEEKPLPVAVSPTTDSPGYIADSDPEEDEEDPKEDPEEDPTDYPGHREDDDDDDDESLMMMRTYDDVVEEEGG